MVHIHDGFLHPARQTGMQLHTGTYARLLYTASPLPSLRFLRQWYSLRERRVRQSLKIEEPERRESHKKHRGDEHAPVRLGDLFISRSLEDRGAGIFFFFFFFCHGVRVQGVAQGRLSRPRTRAVQSVRGAFL